MEGFWCLTVYLTDSGKGGRVTAINITNRGGRWGRREKKKKKSHWHTAVTTEDKPRAHFLFNKSVYWTLKWNCFAWMWRVRLKAAFLTCLDGTLDLLYIQRSQVIYSKRAGTGPFNSSKWFMAPTTALSAPHKSKMPSNHKKYCRQAKETVGTLALCEAKKKKKETVAVRDCYQHIRDSRKLCSSKLWKIRWIFLQPSSQYRRDTRRLWHSARGRGGLLKEPGHH